MKFLLPYIAQLDLRPLPNPTGDDPAATAFPVILSIFFGILGSITFLMIVIGGLRYVLAAGDSNKMAQAKKTIIYALVGLIVTLSAFTIVTFIVRGTSG